MVTTVLPLRRVPRATSEIRLAAPDCTALSAEFDRALAAIEDRWPDAPVRDDAFAAHVRAHLEAERDLAARLPRLHITELFLVWWAMTSPGGMAAFLETYGHDLARTIAAVTSRFPALDARTLLGQLMDELFGGPDPRALEFSGFGSLGAWIDVVATQALLDVAHSVSP
jgi:hypothetical protein